MAARESVAEVSAHDRLGHDDGEPESATAQLAEMVVEAAAALSGKFQPQALREIIAEQAARLLGADLSLLYGVAVEDQGRPVRLLASSSLSSTFAAQLEDLTGTSSLVLRAAESRRVEHAVVDQAACERFSDFSALAASMAPCWVLAAPLLSAGRLFGVLFCAFGSRSAPFQEILPCVRALCALFALALADAEPAAPARTRPGSVDYVGGASTLEPLEAAFREVEWRLAEERRWLRSVIEDFPVAIAVLDERGGPSLLASRRCQELCGGPHPLAVVEIGPCALLCEPGGRPLLLPEMPLVRAARGEGTTCKELWFRRTDGSYVPVVVSAGPIRGEDGAIHGAIASYEDVTIFREIERLREEWTSLVAHDLKQPLSAISAYAGMLSRLPESAGATAWSQKILSNVRRLDRMAEDLLDASKIEARHLSLERRPTDVRGLLHAAVELATAERPDRAIVLTADEDVPPVLVDAARMDQVLGNLLLNAAKYGDPSAPTRVTLSLRDAELEVAIENRGPGIPPDELPRLFQRFQRLSSDRSRSRPSGTGLGLYICKGIVEAHGGRIWAQSEVNKTTSFHFTLPLTETSPGHG
ncbi:ATP-binding protein [Sorangium sp. So ce375]|uniref:sensor histidine kinase n=1 Tax=Sorangium sp. So ce375 TaxID=3133306 RepID=UPI003F5C1F1A